MCSQLCEQFFFCDGFQVVGFELFSLSVWIQIPSRTHLRSHIFNINVLDWTAMETPFPSPRIVVQDPFNQVIKNMQLHWVLLVSKWVVKVFYQLESIFGWDIPFVLNQGQLLLQLEFPLLFGYQLLYWIKMATFGVGENDILSRLTVLGCWCPIQGQLLVPRYQRLGTREWISWFLRTWCRHKRSMRKSLFPLLRLLSLICRT